jgi:predicted metal-dependent enzyme (double-stranded beta helix superfamily)
MSGLRTAPNIAPAVVATELAARDHVWRNLVHFDEDSRTYTRVAETQDWEAWLLTWWPGSGTGVHDHGGATGAIVVLEGELREQVWTTDAGGVRPVERRLAPGIVRSFGARIIHDVRNVGTVPAVSLHVYSPRLTSMTRYLEDLTPVGVERADVDW